MMVQKLTGLFENFQGEKMLRGNGNLGTYALSFAVLVHELFELC
jgi:hypothetical protein